MKDCVVYLYRDPKTLTPRYVGVGKTEKRAWEHVRPKAKTNKLLKNMICKRIKEGFTVEPEITHLGHSDYELAKQIEIIQIAKYGRLDLGTGTLFNHTDGGDGGGLSEVGRLLMSAKAKAQHADPIVSAKMYASQKLSWEQPEVRARRIEGIKKAFANPEIKLKLSKIQKEASLAPGRKERRSSAAKLCQNREEVKLKKSIAIKKSNTPEIQAQRSASIKAANTPEVRAKRSATMKATLARKRLLFLSEMIDQHKLIDQA